MISDEAVEAALKATFADKAISDFNRAVWTPTITTILEAAAPYVAADAWDEGWGEGTLSKFSDNATNPFRSQA